MSSLSRYILAFVVPPLPVFLTGNATTARVNLVLTILALVIFFFFAAGPGFILFVVSVCHSLAVLVRTGRKPAQ